jgi:hypothetical protein
LIRQHLEQLLIGSRTTPKLLVTASKVLGGHQSVVILPLNSKYPGNEESFALNQILDFYGSDKGTFHEYSAAYSGILNSLGRKNFTSWRLVWGQITLTLCPIWGRMAALVPHFELGEIIAPTQISLGVT